MTLEGGTRRARAELPSRRQPLHAIAAGMPSGAVLGEYCLLVAAEWPFSGPEIAHGRKSGLRSVPATK